MESVVAVSNGERGGDGWGGWDLLRRNPSRTAEDFSSLLRCSTVTVIHVDDVRLR